MDRSLNNRTVSRRPSSNNSEQSTRARHDLQPPVIHQGTQSPGSSRSSSRLSKTSLKQPKLYASSSNLSLAFIIPQKSNSNHTRQVLLPRPLEKRHRVGYKVELDDTPSIICQNVVKSNGLDVYVDEKDFISLFWQETNPSGHLDMAAETLFKLSCLVLPHDSKRRADIVLKSKPTPFKSSLAGHGRELNDQDASQIKFPHSHPLYGAQTDASPRRGLSPIDAIILGSGFLAIIVRFFLTMGALIILNIYGTSGIIATCAVICIALVFVAAVYLLVQKAMASPSS